LSILFCDLNADVSCKKFDVFKFGSLNMALTKTGRLKGKPNGNAENPEGQGGDKQRSIRRQNEAADALAYVGYKVENCPTIEESDNLGKGKDAPDYRIEGLVFDGYSPISMLPSNPITWFYGLPEAEQSKIGGKVKQILSLFTLARIEQRENDEFDEYDDDISNTSYAAEFSQLKLAYALAAIHSQIYQKIASGQTRNVVLNLTDSICEAANIHSHFYTDRLEKLENIIVVKAKRDAEPVKKYSTKEGTYAIYPPEAFLVDEYNYR